MTSLLATTLFSAEARIKGVNPGYQGHHGVGLAVIHCHLVLMDAGVHQRAPDVVAFELTVMSNAIPFVVGHAPRKASVSVEENGAFWADLHRVVK